MFITKEDLYSKIRPNEVLQITGGNDSIILHAISYAIGEVGSYLERYDTGKIFSEKAENRNPLIVSFVVDIAINEIVAIACPNINIADRRERRNRAVDYLKQVNNGQIKIPLPLKPSIV